MKRFRLMGVAMLALFAFGAVLAASSSAAVTFLLAEWLVGGTAVSTELLTESPGALLLADTGLKATVECEGILDGWVGPNSLDFISEVLSLAGVGIGQTALAVPPLLCKATEGCSTSASATPEVWAVNLGWETEAELMEDSGSTYFVDLILPHAGGGQPGWTVECTVLLVRSEDECTVPTGEGGVAELTLEGASLLAVFSEAFTVLAEAKLANCSLGGTEKGEVNSVGAIGAPLNLSGGGELTASSDGRVA